MIQSARAALLPIHRTTAAVLGAAVLAACASMPLPERADGGEDATQRAPDSGLDAPTDASDADSSSPPDASHGCGDGTCDAVESCASCPLDCGACPGICGDGVCNGAEDCDACPADCGACGAPLTSCPGEIDHDVSVVADIVAGSDACFVPTASGITIDCRHHLVTMGGGRLLDDSFRADVTLQNCRSNGSIQIYGATANGFALESSEIGSLAVYYPSGFDGDTPNGVVVRNSKMDHLLLTGTANWRVTDSELVSSSTAPLHIEPEDGHCPLDGLGVFSGNLVVNATVDGADGDSALYLLCSSHNLFVNNVFRGLSHAIAMFTRDRAHYNVFESNVFWSESNDCGAVYYGDGNVHLSEPAFDEFRYNVFRSDHASAFNSNGGSSGGNVYEYNLFVSGGSSAYGDGAWISTHPTDLAPDDGPSPGPPEQWRYNTIVTTAPSDAALTWIHVAEADYDFGHNLLVQASGPDIIRVEGGPVGAGLRSDDNVFFDASGAIGIAGSSLAAWRASTGLETRSCAGDPRFVDGSYQIGAGSAAADACGVAGVTAGAYLPPGSDCVESWDCTRWFDYCAPDGNQMRSCRDRAHCRTLFERPPLSRPCE